MRFALGTPMKNSICFYIKTASGLSDWLNQADVEYLMDFILSYDTIQVEDAKPILKEGVVWHGLRLKASKKVNYKTLQFIDGKRRLVSVDDVKDADTSYYFKHHETRDSVKNYWIKPPLDK